MLVKNSLISIVAIFLLNGICFAEDLKIDDLYGTWQITREDGSNPLNWDEFYRFKRDGTVDYTGNDNSRNYRFELKGQEIIIHRGAVTLNRLVKEYSENRIVVFDTFAEMIFIYTRIK